ncbi:alternate F1F0 ATPase, F0 subunit B [Marinobacter santoriniensis NKSG1]|uniref:ATP synthase subunit b n=1 Tax=Marinobacter santoriniensis NKSG1 TaxID=1288826 RepID=M7CWB9_9GAMM|nr:F0F1 ATP synthase subunit delta [Marinobacter santoriniensis]EMP56520.1 alternate F1F0 ATPase, F0 subunit B [Marinobacter santoriniensis NKSG1]
MDIDWITVSAQVVNFLVLVWLLKRFLYQPVIRAMDRREQTIRDRVDDAEQREQLAENERKTYQDRIAELETKREELLEEARQSARQTRSQLLDEAREETAQARTNWMREVSEEKSAFIDGLRTQTLEVVESIARNALRDLADEALEEKMAHALARRIHHLQQELRDALRDSKDAIVVTSAFELSPPVRSALTRAIHEQVGPTVAVDYASNADLICGIELIGGGLRIAWNLSDYLNELTTRIEKAFEPVEAASDGT